jgi:anti-sigma-K factor RskA
MILLDEGIGDDEVLAGEYVLGTLTPSDRISVEGRLRVDPRFAARIARWEADLSALNGGYAEVPAPDVLKKIEARLFPVQRRSRVFPLFQFLAGGVTAAVLLVFLELTFPGMRAPQQIATLTDQRGALSFHAVYDGKLLRVERTSGAAPEAGQSYEVWLIDGENPPKSLGLLRDMALTRLKTGLLADMTLAVSLEPETGSATGAPTGPVLASGVIRF